MDTCKSGLLCRGLGIVVLWMWVAGCATSPPPLAPDARVALKRIPKVSSESYPRADHAILAAFFEANGAKLDAAQMEDIMPASLRVRTMDRNALRSAATANDRVLIVVKADEEDLAQWLHEDISLLVLLPSGLRYEANVTAYIPTAWDRKAATIDLLDGSGSVRSMDEEKFFDRREPLKHAALCLVTPRQMGRMNLSRENQLVLADFWFEQGAYRRADVIYTAVQKATPHSTDVEALIGSANVAAKKNNPKAAVKAYEEALKLEPNNSQILNNLAYSMMNAGEELMIALRHSERADELDPNNPIILETLGTINLRLGDAPAAAEYLERAWARALRRSPQIQMAIMDQLVRAWLAADRQDLAWQVASARQQAFPEYRFPADILLNFPALKRSRTTTPQ